MRDAETLERREAERHEVVRETVRTLHAATRDSDDYRADFHALATLLLGRLGPGRDAVPSGSPEALALYRDLVAPPWAALARDGAESDLLHLMVYEEVFVSVAAGIRSAMLRRDLALAA